MHPTQNQHVREIREMVHRVVTFSKKRIYQKNLWISHACQKEEKRKVNIRRKIWKHHALFRQQTRLTTNCLINIFFIFSYFIFDVENVCCVTHGCYASYFSQDAPSRDTRKVDELEEGKRKFSLSHSHFQVFPLSCLLFYFFVVTLHSFCYNQRKIFINYHDIHHQQFSKVFVIVNNKCLRTGRVNSSKYF